MRKGLFVFAVFLLLGGCSTPKVIYRDSIRVEYREKIVKVLDTLEVPIEKEVIKNVTTDTISKVETKYASSTAVVSKGLLYHSISNKERSIEVPVEREIIYRDSIVYRDRQNEVIKEVNRLTWWQQTRLKMLNIILILLAVLIFGRFAKTYFRKFL